MNKEFLKLAVWGMDLHLVGTEANSAVFPDALRLAQGFPYSVKTAFLELAEIAQC